MHSVLLGVVKTLLGLWLDVLYKDKEFYIGDKMALINEQLQRVQVPDYMTRQQRNISDYKHWKATECKDWLMHYSMPILSGVLNMDILGHYALLVTALYKLNKDNITDRDIVEADYYLKDFCQLFPSFYDVEKQTMNVHMLRHLAEVVKLHGPLFNFSCFGFESMNNHLKTMVHGTRFVNDQICFAVGMTKCLPDLVKSVMADANSGVKVLLQDLSKHLACEDIKDNIPQALGKKRLHHLTTSEKTLFEKDLHQQPFFKLHRVSTKIGAVHSEEYRSQKRNLYTIAYRNIEHDQIYFGSIKYFLQNDQFIYAIVQKLDLIETTILDFNFIANVYLHKYENTNLCLQYAQLNSVQSNRIELVDVKEIIAKCVCLENKKRQKFSSYPPNIQEHS